MEWTRSKNVRLRLRWLEYVEESLLEMKFKCTNTHTEADSGKKLSELLSFLEIGAGKAVLFIRA
jgi:hypothetical protein